MDGTSNYGTVRYINRLFFFIYLNSKFTHIHLKRNGFKAILKKDF